MILKLSNITKYFEIEDKKLFALDDVNLQINKGDFVTIIGPSGCGKSTLLRIIAGINKPSSGEVLWQGTTPKISFVFQNYAIFPYLTVRENIEFGLKMAGVSKKDRLRQVLELSEEVDLREFLDKHPKELSGGMKQRVGIARALAISPDVLLLDEPFSSLDEFSAQALRGLLLKLWQKRSITVMMVTHLIREALELADYIIVMTPRPGTVRITIKNNLSRPRNLRSNKFFAMEDSLKELLET